MALVRLLGFIDQRRHDADLRSSHQNEVVLRAAGPTVGIGLLGCGTVGAAVARRIIEDSDRLADAVGARVELKQVSVLHFGKQRPVELPPGVLTTDSYGVVTHPDIDVVVEAIGSIEVPRRYLLTALVCGKSVVTANKELISTSGWELARAAEARGQELRFDAAVAGAAPVVSALRGPLAGERVTRIVGILNGTSNFILTAMEELDCSFEEAISHARRLGLSEADPAADVDGHDAAAKLAILSSISADAWIPGGRIKRWGIRSISPQDLGRARGLGYRLRLVAEATIDGSDVRAAVRPSLLHESDPLARLDGAECGAHLFTRAGGKVTVLGVGAGGDPSAASVVGDVLATARARLTGAPGRLPSRYLHEWAEDGAPSRKLLLEPARSAEVLDPLDRLGAWGSPLEVSDPVVDLSEVAAR